MEEDTIAHATTANEPPKPPLRKDEKSAYCCPSFPSTPVPQTHDAKINMKRM
ncbi:predicted protein [Plenodomus lingam JN3]|uniref:Predicted protein n=1 Tax=Leptosphaeria maculans (strain JN3 / isolate v23.1.3 / race Av1-4-5-6-7-8) TaxID=985895 RepID=E5A8Y7_LEPMJ|nr:predicted protein [Plenodomus lingam JN3]CBY00082.1 predicted protein [Plenodomus lingam JN3]